MLIVADNDVIGAVALMKRICESTSRREYCARVDVTFAGLAAIGLECDAPDRIVWEKCQAAGAVLVTGNRAGGPESLDQVIRELAGGETLPVITIADPSRLFRDTLYAERCALSLIDYIERINSLRGTGRLFIP